MEWGRAKSILILSFFVLNVLLGYSLWNNKWNLAGSSSGSVNSEQVLKKRMAAKSVKLQTDIPKEMPALSEISVIFKDNGLTTVQKKLEHPVPIRNFLSKKEKSQIPIEYLNQYQYDAAASHEKVYIFDQTYHGLPLFDVQLKLYAEGTNFTGYTEAYADVRPMPDQKTQKVISAATALSALVENYLPTGSAVTSIELGYHGQIYNSETQYMLPSWRVALNDGTIYYVHAFNGDVEVPQAKSAS